MAFVSIPDTVKVAFEQEYNQQTIVNTLYFTKDVGSVEFADLNNLIVLMASWWQNEWAPVIPIGLSLLNISALDLSAPDSFSRVNVYNYAATNVAPPLSSGITKKVNFGTGFSGASNRGSNFWPLSPVDSLDSPNAFETVWISGLIGIYTKIMTGGPYAPPDFTWSVASRKVDGLGNVGSSKPIISIYTRGTDIDLMRSRVDP